MNYVAAVGHMLRDLLDTQTCLPSCVAGMFVDVSVGEGAVGGGQKALQLALLGTVSLERSESCGAALMETVA